MLPITRTQCPDEEKLDFLFNRAGRDFLRYEHLTFAYMDHACEEYVGGSWDFYGLSNDGFYMALRHDKPLQMHWIENAYEGSMSADAAGIAISLMVQNRFAWKVDAQRYGDYFHALRDYAGQHPEAPAIFSFID